LFDDPITPGHGFPGAATGEHNPDVPVILTFTPVPDTFFVLVLAVEPMVIILWMCGMVRCQLFGACHFDPRTRRFRHSLSDDVYESFPHVFRPHPELFWKFKTRIFYTGSNRKWTDQLACPLYLYVIVNVLVKGF
jgi:hypothetical protein